MPNPKIFCNAPWYELHIYWDGSFGICCSENHKAYADSDRSKYNIANMTIQDWFNSEPVREFRTQIHGDQKLSNCSQCYMEEQHGGHSRRIKENQKSAIFVQAFEPSFQQSPGYPHFERSLNNSGFTNKLPIDLHVNLGNYCNLACKMCNHSASTTIAAQEVKWGQVESKQYLGIDWTRDPTVWSSFKSQLLDIPGLSNIHFMGGETLLTDRVEDIVDTMIEHQRFDIGFSFVTNGTVFNPTLIEKLSRFKRTGIEVSIETVSEHNAYVRQGTDTELVLSNIQKFMAYSNNDNITVTLRPAPSLLTIGYYHTLLQYALDHKLLIKSNLCREPKFLYAVNLPYVVKQLYAKKYLDLLDQLDVSVSADFNASNPHNYRACVKFEAEMCIDILNSPAPPDRDSRLQKLVDHCQRWDKVYKLDARKLYPELKQIWDQYGYQN